MVGRLNDDDWVNKRHLREELAVLPAQSRVLSVADDGQVTVPVTAGQVNSYVVSRVLYQEELVVSSFAFVRLESLIVKANLRGTPNPGDGVAVFTIGVFAAQPVVGQEFIPAPVFAGSDSFSQMDLTVNSDQWITAEGYGSARWIGLNDDTYYLCCLLGARDGAGALGFDLDTSGVYVKAFLAQG